MASTKGRSGFGALFKIGDGGGPEVFTSVAELVDPTPPPTTLNVDDGTHNESPGGWVERIATTLQAGDAQLTLNWLPDDASQNLLRTAQNAKRLANFQITIPGSSRICTFAAFVVEIGPTMPHAGKMQAQVRLTPSGPVVFS